MHHNLETPKECYYLFLKSEVDPGLASPIHTFQVAKPPI